MKILYKLPVVVFTVLILGSYTYRAYAVPCPGDGSLPPLGTCCVPPHGGTINSCDAGMTPKPEGTECTCIHATAALEEFFGIINGIMIPIAIIAGIFIIVRAGYTILTSQGNPQELQTGKENLTSAVIGLVFVLMAVSILRVIIKALITGDADISF